MLDQKKFSHLLYVNVLSSYKGPLKETFYSY